MAKAIAGARLLGPELFWTRVDKAGPVPDYAPHLGPCWVWRGGLDPDGYGRFKESRKSWRAHTYAYVQLVGARPDPSLVPDHLCRVRHCVNPAHLEWVTNRVNVVVRGQTVTAMNAIKTHCIHGHEFTPENTYTTRDGRRQCRCCLADASKRLYDRKRRAAADASAQSLAHGPVADG